MHVKSYICNSLSTFYKNSYISRDFALFINRKKKKKTRSKSGELLEYILFIWLFRFETVVLTRKTWVYVYKQVLGAANKRSPIELTFLDHREIVSGYKMVKED